MEKNGIDPAILREKALKSFLCFLYVGKEHPYYKAKPWNDDDRYLRVERMRTLEILASDKKTELVPLDKIKLAMDSSLIQRPETLMFALAMCARQKKSEKLRAAAYYFLNEHCNEWKYFILFIKYASYLCRNDVSSNDKEEKHIGWGRGWKNAVNKFYLDRDAMDLAILVGRHRGSYGWKHKDILKLSHIDILSLEADKRVVLKYVLDGLEEASKEYHNDPEAKKQLDYLKQVDEFRRCQDSIVVGHKIITAGYTIDHVHPKALKSKKVWQFLLRDMDIRTVLKHLPKLSQLGFLTEISPITDKIVQTLTDENNVYWNKILPAEILAVLNVYDEAPSISMASAEKLNAIETEEDDTPLGLMQHILALAKEKKKEETKDKEKSAQPTKKPIRKKAPNMRIRDALRTALSLSQTVDITGSSKKSYLVTIRLPAGGRKNVCAEAGLAIALPLLNRVDIPEDATTIIGHEPRMGFGAIAEITRGMSYEYALELLVNLKKSACSNNKMIEMPQEPILWCYNEKKIYDVVINVTNEPPQKSSINIIRNWKIATNSQDTRFINVIINRGTFELKGDIWHEVLSINGFDPHVPLIIEAYVRGLF